METTKKLIAVLLVAVICLSAVAVLQMFRIRSLKENVELLEWNNDELDYEINRLDNRFSSLKAELEESIREAASLVETVEYSLVGPGQESGTAVCEFYIVPKLISQDMQLEITLGDKTQSLEKSGTGFRGTVEIKMFGEDIPTVAVKSASGTQMQELEDVDLFWICREWLPELFQSMSGVSSTEEGWPQVDLAYGFKYSTEHTGTPVTFTKLTEIRKVNGTEVSNRDVTGQLRDGGEADFHEYYTECILKTEETVDITIRAEDSQGYIHVLETYIESNAYPDGSPEISTGFESIYTADGQLLFGT